MIFRFLISKSKQFIDITIINHKTNSSRSYIKERIINTTIKISSTKISISFISSSRYPEFNSTTIDFIFVKYSSIINIIISRKRTINKKRRICFKYILFSISRICHMSRIELRED